MLEDHEHKHPVHEFDGIIENRVQKPPTYFSILFYGLIIWGVVFIAYFLFSDWSSEDEFKRKMAAHREQAEQATTKAPAATAAGGSTQKSAATAAAQPQVDAAALFADNCAACHGAEGQGGIGPDLTSADYIYGRGATEVEKSIRDGRPNGMPPFGNQFSGAETKALVDYILNL